MSCCARVKRARNSSAIIGFSRSPNGFKPEKSAPCVSCAEVAAAWERGASASAEEAAAVCKKRRREAWNSEGIDFSSSVEETFSWRRHSLSSGRRKKKEKSLEKGDSEKSSRNLLHANRLNIFPLNFQLNAQWRPQVRALHDGATHPDIAGQIRKLCWIIKR